MEAAVKNGAQINNLINNQTALNVALVGYIYDQPRVSAVIWLLDHGADPNVGNGTYSPLDNFVVSSSITLRELNKMTEDDLKAMKKYLSAYSKLVRRYRAEVGLVGPRCMSRQQMTMLWLLKFSLEKAQRLCRAIMTVKLHSILLSRPR